MRQVTQCPACSTQFRVVDDQLKISEGWVRCGRCGEVFDARLAMVTAVAIPPATQGGTAIEVTAAPHTTEAAEPAVTWPAVESVSGPASTFTPTPTPSPTPEILPQPFVADGPLPLETVAAPGDVVEPLRSVLPESPADAVPQPSMALAAATDPAYSPPASIPPASTPPASTPHGTPPADTPLPTAESPLKGTPDAVDIVVDVGGVYESAAPTATPNAAVTTAPTAPAAASTDAPPDAPVTPEVSFVRAARRQVFWSQSWVRWALFAALLSLGVGLFGQVLWHERNRVAAAVPSWRPWLESACQALGCEVGHWQQIEAVRLDGTALVRTGSGAYRLEVGLYNTANSPVATPALELSLTNARDDVVLRRVILAGDWSSPVAELPPQGGVALSVLMSVADTETLRTSGYRALVFYP